MKFEMQVKVLFAVLALLTSMLTAYGASDGLLDSLATRRGQRHCLPSSGKC
jgi:hypothetical protein